MSTCPVEPDTLHVSVQKWQQMSIWDGCGSSGSWVTQPLHSPPDCVLALVSVSFPTNRLFCEEIPFAPSELQLPETKDSEQFVFFPIISSVPLEYSPVKERA